MTNRLTSVQWLICVIAAIGFAFDIYELLMLPLIIAPALRELVNVAPGTPAYNDWVGVMLWVPAIAGGIFGLLGGYLTDRLGRRRVLTWSILLYAFSAFAAGFSTTIWQFLFFRSLTFIGVCVEFVAAVSWLAELFPARSSANACSAIRRRSPRWVAPWSRPPACGFWPTRHRCPRSTAGTKPGATP